MFLEMIAVALLGGLIALDRTAVFQVMISRPIVAAPLIAIILGEPMVGLQVGLVLELLWIHCLPVGASIPPDETIVAVLVTAITVWCERLLGGSVEAVMSLALILIIPAAVLAQRMEAFVRKRNVKSAHAADRAADNVDVRGIQKACLAGIKRIYFAYALIFLLLLPAGTLIVYLIYPLLPDFAIKGLGRFYYLLPLIGIASALSMARLRNTMGVLLASFVAFFGFFEVLW